MRRRANTRLVEESDPRSGLDDRRSRGWKPIDYKEESITNGSGGTEGCHDKPWIMGMYPGDDV